MSRKLTPAGSLIEETAATMRTTADWEEARIQRRSILKTLLLILGILLLLTLASFVARRWWRLPGIPLAVVILAIGGRLLNSMHANTLELLRNYELVVFRDGTSSVRPARTWMGFFPMGWRAIRGTILEGSKPRLGKLWIWSVMPLIFAFGSAVVFYIGEHWEILSAAALVRSWPWRLAAVVSISYWINWWLVGSRFLLYCLDRENIYVVLPKSGILRVYTTAMQTPLGGIAHHTTLGMFAGFQTWNPDLNLIVLGTFGPSQEKLILRYLPGPEFQMAALRLREALR